MKPLHPLAQALCALSFLFVAVACARAAEEPAAKAPHSQQPQAPPLKEEGEPAAKDQPKEKAKSQAELIAEWLEQLDSPNATDRTEAARKLGEAKALVALPKLIKMLSDPDDDAQWQATVAVGAMGAPAVPRLIPVLNEPSERVRWKAENALEMIGAEAVPALMEGLKADRARIRQSAAFLLGRLKDPRAIGPLAAALGDKDKDTRWKAADSLTKFGEQATPVVIKQLASGGLEARQCAGWVFQQTRDPAAVAALVRALKDPDDPVRWKAAIALQKIGRRAAEPLFAILRSGAQDDVKSIATWVLEGIRDITVQTALRDLKAAQKDETGKTPTRPRPAKLPDSVTLVVTSEPPKATVFVDDKYAGITPLTVRQLSPGHHFVKLTKRDHMPWAKLLELLHAEERLTAKLAAKPKGSLTVTSEPSGADVYIDGEYDGKTPLEKTDLDANPYSVRIEKEHFQPWETEVDVRPGKTAKVHGKLASKVEGWYLARLKKDPNDVSCHTELAHYYLVRGNLDAAAKALGAAMEVMARGADTSGYSRRLVQEIDKIWGQVFQFGGGLTLARVRRAVHAAIHGVWRRHGNSAHLRAFLALLRRSVSVDFTQPPG